MVREDGKETELETGIKDGACLRFFLRQYWHLDGSVKI